MESGGGQGSIHRSGSGPVRILRVLLDIGDQKVRAQIFAQHPGVGIGIHQTGFPAGLSLMNDEQPSPLSRQVRIIGEADSLPDQGGGYFKEHPFQGDGGIFVDFPRDLMVEHLLDVHGGIHGDDVAGPFNPCLQGCLAVQASMGRTVILTLQPVMKGKLEALEVGDGLRILQPKELLSGGAEEPLDLSASGWPVGPGVHQDDAQGVQDPTGLAADKGAPVVSIQAADATVGFENVADAGFELQGAVRKAQRGVQDPAGGIVQEGQQDHVAAFSLFVGQLQRVHAVHLDAFQRGEELKLQVLLLFGFSDSLLPIQSRRAHQARNRGTGGGAGDGAVCPKFSQHR